MKKEQFERAKKSPDHGVLVHLICNEADTLFYSEEPDLLSDPQRAVVCVETFFSALCDGGVCAWFDLDHGQLAPHAPGSLLAVGLPAYADLAEETLRYHHHDALPTKVSEWDEHLQRIRLRHQEEDCSEVYAPFDARFFALFQSNPNEFRDKLYDYIVKHEAEFLSEVEDKSTVTTRPGVRSAIDVRFPPVLNSVRGNRDS